MKVNFSKPLLLGALAMIVVSYKSEKKETAAVDTIPGINLGLMDTTVIPKDDFFR